MPAMRSNNMRDEALDFTEELPNTTTFWTTLSNLLPTLLSLTTHFTRQESTLSNKCKLGLGNFVSLSM
jgi:hypothetical protein